MKFQGEQSRTVCYTLWPSGNDEMNHVQDEISHCMDCRYVIYLAVEQGAVYDGERPQIEVPE